jgi:hypothetical protein
VGSYEPAPAPTFKMAFAVPKRPDEHIPDLIA